MSNIEAIITGALFVAVIGWVWWLMKYGKAKAKHGDK